jgi:hypothetical protein
MATVVGILISRDTLHKVLRQKQIVSSYPYYNSS